MVDDTPAPTPAPDPRRARREARIAALLLGCVAIVVFWEVMASRSQRPFAPFALTASSFATFSPPAAAYTVRRLDVSPDPVEPNILALLVKRASPSMSAPVLVRLVHGYNMVDCMRIKGDRVSLLADTREAGSAADGRPRPTSAAGPGTPLVLPTPLAPNLQVWRLSTPANRDSVWVTAMLNAGDFRKTTVDTRDMAFPRVDVPDHPGWFPQGLTWRSLRHPIQNGRLFLRAKWNSSRADLLTFLGLRQPAWASEELLTLVAAPADTYIPAAREAAVARDVLEAHAFVLRELQAWARQREELAESPP